MMTNNGKAVLAACLVIAGMVCLASLWLGRTNPKRLVEPSVVSAAATGNLSLLKRLWSDGADLNIRDPWRFGWTPLIAAIYNGQTNVIQFLLDQGAKSDSADNIGRTPLMWAVTQGDTNTARLLLEKGANPDLNDKNGITAYGYAEASPHRAALLELLSKRERKASQTK